MKIASFAFLLSAPDLWAHPGHGPFPDGWGFLHNALQPEHGLALLCFVAWRLAVRPSAGRRARKEVRRGR